MSSPEKQPNLLRVTPGTNELLEQVQIINEANATMRSLVISASTNVTQTLHRLQSERDELSTRIDHLLAELANLRTVDTDTIRSGHTPLHEIAARFQHFATQERNAFLVELRKQLPSARHKPALYRILPLIYQYTLIQPIRQRIHERLVQLFENALPLFHRLTADENVYAAYRTMIEQIKQLSAEGVQRPAFTQPEPNASPAIDPTSVAPEDINASEDDSGVAKPSIGELASNTGGVDLPVANPCQDTSDAGLYETSSASGENSGTESSVINTETRVGRELQEAERLGEQVPDVPLTRPQQLLLAIWQELEETTVPPNSEILVRAADRLLQRGEELAHLITGTRPAGDLLIPTPSEPFDPDRHNAYPGSDPSGEIESIVWPGYLVGDRLYVYAEVTTRKPGH